MKRDKIYHIPGSVIGTFPFTWSSVEQGDLLGDQIPDFTCSLFADLH